MSTRVFYIVGFMTGLVTASIVALSLAPSSTRVVQGAQGEITVVCADTVVADDGKAAWGIANYSKREITTECGLQPNFEKTVLLHERCHFALSDTHVVISEFVEEEETAALLEERICDAMAAGLR